jgi:NADH:ubiquinone oxidoreductase subunit 6 (subunit J)
VLFYTFAGMAVLFGGMMISQTQPVHAALSFAMVVLSTCGLFLLQAAPFLMAATIIIYAGAIVVTFLFVIMLAQQNGLDNADYRSREPLLASVAGFVLLAALLCVLHRDYGMERGNEEVITQIAAHLQKIEEAEKAPSTEKLKEALKDGDVLSAFQDLVKPFEGKPLEGDRNYKNKLVSRLIELHGKILDLDGEGGDVPQAAASIRKQLKEVHALGWRLQNELRGVLQPDPARPLSSYSGLPPNQAPPQGKVRLPADNVAAIGQTLFTDYLIAVELAATLLLVATIGAIAIAGRKSEGLK